MALISISELPVVERIVITKNAIRIRYKGAVGNKIISLLSCSIHDVAEMLLVEGEQGNSDICAIIDADMSVVDLSALSGVWENFWKGFYVSDNIVDYLKGVMR